jgi:hypothetical protein
MLIAKTTATTTTTTSSYDDDYYDTNTKNLWPIPVTKESKARVCGWSLAGIEGLNPVVGMDVCSVYVLPGTGMCVGPITRPEESYRLWCVSVCDLDTSTMRQPVYYPKT